MAPSPDQKPSTGSPQNEPPHFTEEVREEILAALREKAPNPRCVMCGHEGWQLHEGFVFFVLQDNFDLIKLGGAGLPCVAISCGKCGNTQFMNVLLLGLKHLLPGGAEETQETKTG